MRVLPDDDFPHGTSMNLPPWMRPAMCDMSEPMDISPVKPSIPQDHLEPSGKMRDLDERLKNQSVILDTASRWMREAQEYKALWVCEVTRGDHTALEHYSVQELDKARAEAGFWEKDKDATGAIAMRRQS